ncbi:MAG: FecR family protein [Ferruginibacter sp.]
MTNDRIWTLLIRKLSGESTATEQAELEQLLQHEPGLVHTVQDIEDWWSTHPHIDKDFLEATYLLHLDRMKSRGLEVEAAEDITALKAQENIYDRKTRSSMAWILASLVIFIALATLSYFFLQKNSIPKDLPLVHTTEIEARYGARSKVQLPDGSNVWLNSGSKLRYDEDFKNGTRDVYLTGEAYFDVVKNPAKPFTIHTQTMAVRVLGTQFNVKAYTNDKTTETSLIHGSVLVTMKNNPQQQYLLKPNEKLVLPNETGREIKTNGNDKTISQPAELSDRLAAIKNLSYIQNTKVEVETSWTKNILSFYDEPFSAVAHKMERWYDVNFEFENARWENEYLTGSFEQETLQQALSGLAFSTGFKYKMDGKTILIY